MTAIVGLISITAPAAFAAELGLQGTTCSVTLTGNEHAQLKRKLADVTEKELKAAHPELRQQLDRYFSLLRVDTPAELNVPEIIAANYSLVAKKGHIPLFGEVVSLPMNAAFETHIQPVFSQDAASQALVSIRNFPDTQAGGLLRTTYPQTYNALMEVRAQEQHLYQACVDAMPGEYTLDFGSRGNPGEGLLSGSSFGSS
ncbi:hypothetical protein [Corynebacterium efficiens]|uniref:hypothetical protein n=1 Tax=Corynebacterium efficiens TaxID=152794 RepID=UPI001E2A1393|nr:hypothetical protein [Corynebacterium efficiens]